MQNAKNTIFRRLRDVVIFDFTTSLRPSGGKIRDFALMLLNIGVFHILTLRFFDEF